MIVDFNDYYKIEWFDEVDEDVDGEIDDDVGLVIYIYFLVEMYDVFSDGFKLVF